MRNALRAFVQPDIRLSVGPPAETHEESVKNRSKELGRVLSKEFITKLGRNSDFVDPPSHLNEIAAALEVEPYIYQSVRKHREMILKEGFELLGSDEEMVEYCKRRLFQIQTATGIPTATWLRDLATNLITYHSAQLVLRRDRTRANGRRIRLYNKNIDPIAGIFVPDPTTMSVKVDRYGSKKKWRQEVERETVDFDPRDVIDFTIDTRPGTSFGLPYLLPVLDDVRALRRMEEIAAIVAQKEAWPLYHIRVGTDERPAMVLADGSDEVSVAEGQWSSMPMGGTVVTSERYEVKLVSREGSSIDLIPYLEYFESRVLAGLRLSQLDIGRGDTANRGTAQNLTKSIEDAAKDYQEVLTAKLTNCLLFYLLLEGGFNVTHENIVSFTFPMIDREELRAHQNHGLQLFMSSAITEDEFRKEYLNKKPLTERQGLFRDMEAKVEGEILTKKAAATRSQVSNRSRPANQSGRKSTKTRVTANDYSDMVASAMRRLKDGLVSLINKVEGLDQEDIDREVKQCFRNFLGEVCQGAQDTETELIKQGISQAMEASDATEQVTIGRRALDKFRTNFTRRSFLKVINPYLDRICSFYHADAEDNRSSYMVFGALESFRKSIDRLVADQLQTFVRFGFAYASRKLGHKEIVLRSSDGNSKSIDLSKIIYKELIPTPETSHWEIGLA